VSNQGVERERWAQLTIFEQMGNIGSEVGRAINAQRRGKTERMNGAIDRAIDLFDATAAVWAQKKSPRTREILRAKEQFLGLFFGDADEVAAIDADGLERYFMQFAAAARMA